MLLLILTICSLMKRRLFGRRSSSVQWWNCTEHSLPDKLAACWHHRDHPGVCYPITLGNLNYWAALIVSHSTFTLLHICTDYQWGSFTQLRDPQKYNENEKPLEMNLSPSYCSSASRPPPPQQPMPMSMPYPFYPPPHMYLPQPPWPTASTINLTACGA